MSRAYRIEVKEALEIKVSAQDRVESTISMLGLLPQERMESLLTEELIAEGFEPHDCHLEKKTQAADGTALVVSVEPHSGRVVVETAAQREKTYRGLRSGVVLDDANLAREEQNRLRGLLQEDCKTEEGRERDKAQKAATNLLEESLPALREVIDRAVHRTSVRALREKASQIGQIRSIDEDPAGRRMTIVLEV
jgi:hypothetical protein